MKATQTAPAARDASEDRDASKDSANSENSENSVRSNPLTSFRDRVRSWPGGALGWRVGVTVIGVAVVVGGIVLLPLPGPGWLIIFAGLGILATEYEWASRLLKYARDKVKAWTQWVGRQPRWIQAVIGLLGAAFLVAVALAVWYFLY